MRQHGLIFGIGILMGLTLAAGTASAGAPRPGTDLGLFLCLNGEETRPQFVDGGGLGMYVTDAGAACATVPPAGCWKMNCDTAVNVCPVALDYGGATYKDQTNTRVASLAQDGGCNNTVHDANYGAPLPASTDRFFIGNSGTTSVCVHPQSGATANCALFQMR